MVQYIETDHLALSVHVLLLQDLPLPTLSWDHLFFDALGLQSLLQVWQAVPVGREQDTQAFIPYERVPIAAVA